jgi:DNA processing protein
VLDDRAGYLALALIPGMTTARLSTLLNACETPHGATSAPFAFLCTLPGFSRAAATAVRGARAEEGARVLARVEELGGTCLLPTDEEFPVSFREIPDPPSALFALGQLSLLRTPAVAIVGSRDHSGYGLEVCGMVAGGAARQGLVVVSGMARGLDSAAHSAALDAGGGTIGVLGNGLGVVYPAANRLLYERVAVEGLLLTEFPPGERPRAWSFPRRNRLISGLARVTVVIEAAAGSGTLITVASALEQGREVMAVPGPITSARSVGTNRLLRDGATPLLGLEDLLAQYPEVPGPSRPARDREAQMLLPTFNLTSEEQRVVDALDGAGTHLDRIVTVVGLPPGDLLARLCGLEIAGVVEQLPGRVFRRVRS